jgi:glycosyltransferase involved in cell wall biosynthesis
MSIIKLSALVVAHNEERILEECLKRLMFADELVVVLDKCTDRSSAIAQKYTENIIEGNWEIEGERRNIGIDNCRGEWILEADADEWITESLAVEIRETIDKSEYDLHDIPVKNYIGDHYVKYGWGGGSFGKEYTLNLYRKGTKSWGNARVHPHLTVTGEMGPALNNSLEHYMDANISAMIGRLDRYTTYRAKDLAEADEIGSLANNFRKFISRFLKVYIRRKAYKEGGYGFMNALCSGLYPLISHVKATNEEQNLRPSNGSNKSRMR